MWEEEEECGSVSSGVRKAEDEGGDDGGRDGGVVEGEGEWRGGREGGEEGRRRVDGQRVEGDVRLNLTHERAGG